MIRNLKALGLAVVALAAIGALTASAASAVTLDHFTAPGFEKAWLTGVSHDNIFTVTHTPAEGANPTFPERKFECTTSQFTGTTLNGSTEATVLAKYEGKINATPHGIPCSATLGDVTIHMNDCHYLLSSNTSKEHPSGSGKFDAPIWIQCPAGKEIEITAAGGCIVKVPSQTPTEGGVIYKNLPLHSGKPAVEVIATATGITYTAPGIACAFGGLQAEANNADYAGTVKVTGYEHKGGEMTAPTEGNQIKIEVS